MQMQAPVVGSQVGELYRHLATSVERLVHHRGRVRREGAQAWLVKTAANQARKLIARGRRELSLEAMIDGRLPAPADRREPDALELWERRPGPAELCEQRELLDGLRGLPPRDQQLLWLYGLGFSYAEIALRSRCTQRTVERQLQRARAMLREPPPGGASGPGRACAGAARPGSAGAI